MCTKYPYLPLPTSPQRMRILVNTALCTVVALLKNLFSLIMTFFQTLLRALLRMSPFSGGSFADQSSLCFIADADSSAESDDNLSDLKSDSSSDAESTNLIFNSDSKNGDEHITFLSNDFQQSFRTEISNSKNVDTHDKLRMWAINHNVSHVALKNLLQILSEASSSTFLKTPKKVVTRSVAPKNYFYFGTSHLLIWNI